MKSILQSAMDSSAVFQWMRRISRESRVRAAAAGLTRMLRRPLSDVAARERRARSRDDAAELAWVVALAESSALVSTIQRWLNAPLLAWREAGAARLYAEVSWQIRTLENWERVRLLGWILLVGVVTASAVGSLGDATSSWPETGIWASLLMFAVSLIAGAHKIAAAWREHRESRSTQAQ